MFAGSDSLPGRYLPTENRMLMRQKVNNDVSNDRPVNLDAKKALEGYHPFLLQASFVASSSLRHNIFGY